MPVRLCSATGCGETAHYRGRCGAHARAENHPSKFANVYSTKRWRILRRGVLMANPICASCNTRLATVGDHVRPLAAGGAPYDPMNIQSLCAPCHGIKTTREQAAGVL